MEIAKRLKQAPKVSSCHSLLITAYKNVTVTGSDWPPVDALVMEFGVNSGSTIEVIAKEAHPKTVYGFDSFEGLPEKWNESNPKGMFDRGGNAPSIESPNVKLVIGWFDKTLPNFLREHQGPAALIHIDCDLYSSTKVVLDALNGRIVEGTVICFNEFWDYDEAHLHEAKAFQEFLDQTGFKAIPICWSGESYIQAAFIITGK